MDKNCGEIRAADDGKEVVMYGWCRNIRDHGGKLFIDLADRYGMTQIVFEGDIKKKADLLGREYTVKISGKVRKREADAVDATSNTGDMEVYASDIDTINEAEIPPFEIGDEKEAFLPGEDIRLRYRYIDLRRSRMIKNIVFRDSVTKSIRKFFWENDFLELETPILVRDTYDASGSRTFVVPSRVNKGEFFALPQSPQLYKQLCMVAGLDKYFQIAKVFRDEDPREDRQPEFVQMDVEVSFKDEKYIQNLIEKLVQRVFSENLHKEVKIPFRHMDYSEAIKKYGNDKPDMRFDYELVDISDEAKRSNYNILKRVLESGGKAIAVAFDADYGSEKQRFDKDYMLESIETAKNLGLRGLTWMYYSGNKLHSVPESIAASFAGVEKDLSEKLELKDGNVVIIGADTSESTLLGAMSKLRRIIGIKIGKFKEEHSFLWVDKFPLYEKDEVTGALQPAHNPFVAPTEETMKYLDSEPEKALGKRYDLVLNGVEIGGGSIRIHKPDMQRKALKSMGLSDEDIENSLGFLLKALSYGAPIHGGIAFGLDRFVAVMAGSDDIKDFILFPRNRKAESPLDGSPSPIDSKRLKADYDLYKKEQ